MPLARTVVKKNNGKMPFLFYCRVTPMCCLGPITRAWHEKLRRSGVGGLKIWIVVWSRQVRGSKMTYRKVRPARHAFKVVLAVHLLRALKYVLFRIFGTNATYAMRWFFGLSDGLKAQHKNARSLWFGFTSSKTQRHRSPTPF